jgi:hypothetical protein
LSAALSGVCELATPLERVPSILVPYVERAAHDDLALPIPPAGSIKLPAAACHGVFPEVLVAIDQGSPNAKRRIRSTDRTPPSR